MYTHLFLAERTRSVRERSNSDIDSQFAMRDKVCRIFSASVWRARKCTGPEAIPSYAPHRCSLPSVRAHREQFSGKIEHQVEAWILAGLEVQEGRAASPLLAVSKSSQVQYTSKERSKSQTDGCQVGLIQYCTGNK